MLYNDVQNGEYKQPGIKGFEKYVIIKISKTEYRHLPHRTGVCLSPTLQSMEEKESGIFSHLHIFTFCEACDDASDMYFLRFHFTQYYIH